MRRGPLLVAAALALLLVLLATPAGAGEPTNEARRDLAQRLLGAKRTAEALPHVEAILASSELRDPVAFEVAVWVFVAEGRAGDALAAARRWQAADPSSWRPRRVIADLTHWSARWREAGEQYPYLLRVPGEEPVARARMELLRHDHPNVVRADIVRWIDSVDVRYLAIGVEGTKQLPARLVLTPRAVHAFWRQLQATGEAEVDTWTAGAAPRLEAWDAFTPEVRVSLETDSVSNVAGGVSLGGRLSIGGWLFGRVWGEYDRYRASLEAARRDVRAAGVNASLYAEPLPWLFAAAEGSFQWLSDGNFRRRLVGAVGVHNTDALQIEPRAFVQYESFRSSRPGATPYFTPTEPLMAGGELTARYRLPPRLLAEASIGVVVQGGVVFARPGGRLAIELFEHVQLGASATYLGSPQYKQVRFDGSLGWLF